MEYTFDLIIILYYILDLVESCHLLGLVSNLSLTSFPENKLLSTSIFSRSSFIILYLSASVLQPAGNKDWCMENIVLYDRYDIYIKKRRSFEIYAHLESIRASSPSTPIIAFGSLASTTYSHQRSYSHSSNGQSNEKIRRG